MKRVKHYARQLLSDPWLLLVASQFLLIILALGLGWKYGIAWQRELELNENLLWGALGGTLLAWSNIYLCRWGWRAGWQWALEYRHFCQHWDFLTPGRILFLSLASGCAEEALFRGVLVNLWGPLPQGLLFALLHYGGPRLWFLPLWSGILGCLLGYYIELGGELGAAMALHAANNLWALSYISKELAPKSESA